MYSSKAVKLEKTPAFCQEYIKTGCSAVLSAAIANKVKADWAGNLAGRITTIKEDYLPVLNDVVKFIVNYSGCCLQSICSSY
jgi:hypothetical protein